MPAPEWILPAAPNLNAFPEIGADQRIAQQDDAFAHRHADIVGQFLRRGTGAALSAIDDDEIGRDPRIQHGLYQRHDLVWQADAQLEAHRLAAGLLAQQRQPFQEAGWRRESGMRGRRIAVLPRLYPARLCHLLRDLGARQHAAMARLGSLAQLDLDHLYLFGCGGLGEPTGIERTIRRSAVEIARSDFPDQISAMLPVIAADAAFTGIVCKSAELRALVECLDRALTVNRSSSPKC